MEFMPQSVCFLPPIPDDYDEGDQQDSTSPRVVLAALPSPVVGGQPLFVPVPVMPSRVPAQSSSKDGGNLDDKADESDDKKSEPEASRMCSYFYHLGHCKKGDTCEFSHEWHAGMEVPPPPSALLPAQNRSDSTEKHQSHSQQQAIDTGGSRSLTGKLLESASRKFFDPVCGEDTSTMTLPRRHIPRQPQNTYSHSFLASGLFRSKPCTFFFETGFCLKGDHCNFSHDPHLLLEQTYAKQQASASESHK